MKLFSTFVQLLVLLCLSASSQAQSVRWLLPGRDYQVSSSVGFGEQTTQDGQWRAKITDVKDPGFVISPLIIDASRKKYLYVRLS
ncbi:MAG: hypothetical protein WCL39_06225, partial [Armatimonadota bacterium]